MFTLLVVGILAILYFEFWKDRAKGHPLEEFVQEMRLLVSLNSEVQRAFHRGDEMKADLLPYALGTLPQLTAWWNQTMHSQSVPIHGKIVATQRLITHIDRMYCLWKSPSKQEQLKIAALDPSLSMFDRIHARHLLGELGLTIGPVFLSKTGLDTIPTWPTCSEGERPGPLLKRFH